MSVTGTPSSSSLLSALVQGLVQDNSGKLLIADDNGQTGYDRAIASAINTYSKHQPAIAAADITGDGGHDYALPEGWTDGISRVVSIEYPVGSVPAELLDSDACLLYQSPTAQKIRLINAAPAAAETFRVIYTILRTELTILTADLDAVASLAAAICLEQLANLFLQTSDPTIQADVVNYRTKSQEAASRAKTMRKLYKEHLNLKDEDTVQPASAIASLEQNYPGGADRLTHPRWSRRRR